MTASKGSTGNLVRTLPRYGINALQRGLAILSLLADTPGGLTATEIARSAKLHGSTVHRFLVNLEEGGYIVRDDRGGYQLGPRCISLAGAALDGLDVRRVSYAALKELNRVTRETIHLTVRNGLTAVYVEKFDSLEPLRIHSRVGANVPLHCTAVGKVFLAFLPNDEQADLLKKMKYERFTQSTITSIQAMEAELKNVRRMGYAIDNAEHEPHIRCIAGPVWDHQSAVAAAFSLTGPAARMHRARVRDLIPRIKKTSLLISEALGYAAPKEKGA